MLSFSIRSEFANFELMRDVRREPHSPSYPYAIRIRSRQRHRSLEGVVAGMAVYFPFFFFSVVFVQKREIVGDLR